jgi:hypothetical protein
VSPERPSLIALPNGDFRFLFVGTQILVSGRTWVGRCNQDPNRTRSIDIPSFVALIPQPEDLRIH